MIQLEPHNRKSIAPLFAKHKHLCTVIGAIIETDVGTAVTDDPANPHVAKLELVDFTFVAGNENHPAAKELAKGLNGIVIVPNRQWRNLLYDIHGEQIKIHHRYACDGSQLSLEHLQPLVDKLNPDFTIKKLDRVLVAQTRDDVTPDLVDNFGSINDFLAQGFGFSVVENATGRVVCGVSTFAVCGNDIEVEIDTHPDFRRKGLATAVAARMLIYCLQNNLTPHWDGHNPTSSRLAQRLGYKVQASYETYMITSNS